MNKEYLGDSVYVEYDGFGLMLTTEDGSGVPSNSIYLESEVLTALSQYADRIAKGNEDEGSGNPEDACRAHAESEMTDE